MKRKILGIVLFIITYTAAISTSVFLFGAIENINTLLKFLIFNASLVSIIGLFSLVLSNNSFIKFFQIASTTSTLIICNIILSHHLLTLIVTIPIGILLLIQLISHIYKFRNVQIDDGFIDYFKNKKLYPLINISLNYVLRMVTVFLMNLPLIAFFNCFSEGTFTNDFNVSTILACIIMLVGIVIYTLAVRQKYRERDKLYPTEGIFKRARFTDCFGKILVYIGLYLCLFSLNSTLWVLFLSPLFYLLVHVLLVIPIKEKQIKLLDENYLERVKTTNIFIFFMKK